MPATPTQYLNTIGALRPAATTAAAVDPNPNDPFTIIRNLLGGANTAHGGMALGPDYIRNLLRKRAMLTARNQRQRGAVRSRLFGLDPFAARQEMLDTERNASSNQANALNEADIQGGMDYRQLLASILGGERGYQNAGIQQRYAAGEARGMKPHGLGGFLGQVGGAALGGLFGGGGDNNTPDLSGAANYGGEPAQYRPPRY